MMSLKFKCYIVSRELFQAMLIAYMVLVVVETISPRLVSNFFNINYLLTAVLVFGVIMVTTETPEFLYD